ncbi:MAG: hypothetical protein ABJA78_02080 [Ferruginibacter sp.]
MSSIKNKLQAEKNSGQRAAVTKKQADKKNNHRPAIDTTATDSIKNTAKESEGLNQEKTTGNELEPGTH